MATDEIDRHIAKLLTSAPKLSRDQLNALHAVLKRGSE